MKLIGKSISDNFWIIFQNEKKIGNIKVNKHGVEFNRGKLLEKFKDLPSVEKTYEIDWQRFKINIDNKNAVFGYPTKTFPYNREFDICRRLPLYTTETNSKSKRAAGYYVVNYGKKGWVYMFCPKRITLDKYGYSGPYMDKKNCPTIEQVINYVPR
jgi:hypothetical protein